MKKKFNIIDAAVILVIIGVVAFIGIKLTNGKVEEGKEPQNFRYTFHVEEMPDFVKEYIKEGDKVQSFENTDVFGKLTDVSYGEAECYIANDAGQLVRSTKEGHCSADFEFEGEGIKTSTGVYLGVGVYGVGHSMAMRIGNAKVYGKISGIEPVK